MVEKFLIWLIEFLVSSIMSVRMNKVGFFPLWSTVFMEKVQIRHQYLTFFILFTLMCTFVRALWLTINPQIWLLIEHNGTVKRTLHGANLCTRTHLVRQGLLLFVDDLMCTYAYNWMVRVLCRSDYYPAKVQTTNKLV